LTGEFVYLTAAARARRKRRGEGEARRKTGDGNDERLRRDERDDAMMLRDGEMEVIMASTGICSPNIPLTRNRYHSQSTNRNTRQSSSGDDAGVLRRCTG